MNVFDFLFKKRTITFLGRAGLHCFYDNRNFFIDSEMLVGPSYNIVIYSDRIYLIKNKEMYTVDDATKAAVLAFVKDELEKRQIKADVS